MLHILALTHSHATKIRRPFGTDCSCGNGGGNGRTTRLREHCERVRQEVTGQQIARSSFGGRLFLFRLLFLLVVVIVVVVLLAFELVVRGACAMRAIAVALAA